jgi:type 1 glutamine amidotransferase
MDDFVTWDELYHRMVPMHGAAYHVLATAYSAPEKKGTGAHEPMLLVSQYGRARVFYQILGHVWPKGSGDYKGHTMMSFENASFQKSLLRGCEWAATGEVTLP